MIDPVSSIAEAFATPPSIEAALARTPVLRSAGNGGDAGASGSQPDPSAVARFRQALALHEDLAAEASAALARSTALAAALDTQGRSAVPVAPVAPHAESAVPYVAPVVPHAERAEIAEVPVAPVVPHAESAEFAEAPVARVVPHAESAEFAEVPVAPVVPHAESAEFAEVSAARVVSHAESAEFAEVPVRSRGWFLTRSPQSSRRSQPPGAKPVLCPRL